MLNLKRWWPCLGALAVLSSVCQGQNCRQWQVAIPQQSGYFVGPVAYDSARARHVMRGVDFDTFHDRYIPAIWEWDGQWWTPRRLSSQTQPNLMDGQYNIAFDEARGRLVAFDTTANGTTWELDGAAWIRLNVAGPSPRIFDAMTYDPIRRRVLLFGGWANSSGLADTWSWDGQTWARLSNAGPSPRGGVSIAFDSSRDRLVVFGGSNSFGPPLADTWEWDGNAWAQRATSGPSARANASMAYDPALQKTVLFGGLSGTASLSDTWEWDGQSWTSVQANGPSPRAETGMTYDPVSQRVLLFGGGNGAIAISDEVWEWDGATWTRRGPGAPLARRGHGLAYDSDRQLTVLFGGYSNARDRDAFTWERADGPWVRVSVQGPPARYGNAMAYDPSRHRTVLFGGLGWTNNGTIDLGDTWEWDGATWSQVSSTGPSLRHGHGMTYDPDRQTVILYGGSIYANGQENPHQDMWEWNGTAWTQLPDGPHPLASVPITYNTDTHRLVLFVSQGMDSTLINETWEWDGDTWQLFGGLPGAWLGRTTQAFCYDPALQRVLLFAGSAAGGLYSDLWEREGRIWTQRFSESFLGRSDTPMVYDAARSRMVLFGGQSVSSYLLGDTLELPSAPASLQIVAHPADQTIPNGGTATFSVVVDGDGPFTYQWYVYTSIALVDGTETMPDLARSISGATTSTLVLTSVRVPPWGNTPRFATCVVANAACNPITSNAGRLTLLPCGSPDFDFDGSPGTDADIEAFFACLAGDCCAVCGNPDFNGDGDVATDADIEAFFRVIAGGSC